MTNLMTFLTSLILLTACGNATETPSETERVTGTPEMKKDEKTALQDGKVNHTLWDELLKKHVDNKGMVNYKGMMADSLKLNEYLDLLRKNHPNEKTWGEKERLAYWINAYNAFTVKLITKHYPVKSIKDIGSGINIPFVSTPWDIKFIEIENEKYDLNNLEHSIIRKEFDEPRIHFVLVCAAKSCPKLRNEAFTPDRLEEQLEDEATYFFNNENKNKISAEKIQISKLLDWYWGDFKDTADSRVEYVNRYSKTKANADAKVEFLGYSWELNEQ